MSHDQGGHHALRTCPWRQDQVRRLCRSAYQPDPHDSRDGQLFVMASILYTHFRKGAEGRMPIPRLSSGRFYSLTSISLVSMSSMIKTI